MDLKTLKAGLSKQTIRAQVSERLGAMIRSGLLRPGDELPSERELAATLAVSRETVRGAIQALAAVGLLETSQGARTRVTAATAPQPPAPERLRELQAVHEARELVELPVLRLAAQRIGTADLDRLARLVEDQHGLLGDAVGFQISDAEFHDVIWRAGGNPRLSGFLAELYAFRLDARRAVLSRPEAVAQSLADHVAILTALKARDPEAAASAAARHLARIRDTTRAAL